MKKYFKFTLIFVFIATITVIGVYKYLPVNRVDVTSELIMLGDLNNDKVWDKKDKNLLENCLDNPFMSKRTLLFKLDVNNNNRIDFEDITFLNILYEFHDPYLAEKNAIKSSISFPKPREFFKYMPRLQYKNFPLYLIDNNILENSPLDFLLGLKNESNLTYKNQLDNEILNEAKRFIFAYNIRKNGLNEIEKKYVNDKIGNCNRLFEENKEFQLLLNLFSLVEDAETLTVGNQSDFIKKILFFRDHLKELLLSKDYVLFEQGELSKDKILSKIEFLLKQDLLINLKIKDLESPRNFKSFKNYVERAEWQIYKSKTKNKDFKKLIEFAQNDRRYLRAVSMTSPKLTDTVLKNHNLPMILLFREALKITNNNKKAAVGLLDEAIRIPLGWVKTIPKNMLPSSVAFENFLLPGNKEDGLDKSRHWNVFGGVAIYKSPKESLILALKRESMDLRESDYSKEAMREFIRDTISNINGIYYVTSIDLNLIYNLKK